MTRRTKIWLAVATIFTLINLGGAPYAAILGEGPHAAVHVVLFIVGVVWMWRLTQGAGREQLPTAQPADQRLEQLQQSVDAVAIEVERLGEAQRYREKLEAERNKDRR
jgi:fatty acid desaturase